MGVVCVVVPLGSEGEAGSCLPLTADVSLVMHASSSKLGPE